MDFLSLLSAMEYKVLNARNAEILRTAYAVQDENINLLKAANAALVENASLLRCRVEQLVAEIFALSAANEALRQKLPPPVDYSPSQAAWEILAEFEQRDATQINDKRDVSTIARPHESIEAAFDELCSARVVELSSIGDYGCWFTLTGYGKEFLARHPPSRHRRAADCSNMQITNEALPASNTSAH